jgi:hypothetical protein
MEDFITYPSFPSAVRTLTLSVPFASTTVTFSPQCRLANTWKLVGES